MKIILALVLATGATSLHAATFGSRSSVAVVAASCPDAPLWGECPNIEGTIPIVPIGDYPLVQEWKLDQPGFDASAYISSLSTGYSGAIANVYADGLSAVLQSGAFVRPDDSGRYAVAYGVAAALYAYSYRGAEAVALPLVGDIDFTISFAPAAQDLNYSFGQSRMRMVVGTQDLYTGTRLAEGDLVCGGANVLAAGYASGGAGGFENNFVTQSFRFTLDLTLGCDGQPLTIAPGQDFYVYTFLDTYAQRGATTDATHSFHVNLAPGTPPEVEAALRAGLLLRTVPEPASWAMMIFGFGIVGTTLRQRRSISRAA